VNHPEYAIVFAVFSLGACAGSTAAPRQATPTAAGADQGDTPEGAIQRLESAYRAKDLEALVAAKDFRAEARLMLQHLAREQPGSPDMSGDQEVVTKTAEVLELAFRQQITQQGFPDMSQVRCSFAGRQPVTADLVVVQQICTYPDGGKSRQRINVARTASGWRVLNPLD
jgi:hypothetical protein